MKAAAGKSRRICGLCRKCPQDLVWIKGVKESEEDTQVSDLGSSVDRESHSLR